jgi:hypothetical protein
MAIRFRFVFAFSASLSIEGETATLYRQTWQTIPGTSEPSMNFEQVATGTVQSNIVDFNQPVVDGYFLRLGSNTILYRSNRLSENDFTPVEGQPDVREVPVSLYDTGVMHMTLDEIEDAFPATPVFSVLKNTPQAKGIRIDSMTIKKVSQFLEVSGEGAALSFYDPNTGASVELFPFDYVYRFELEIFTGVPVSQRILNVESDQVVVKPKATGLGSNVMNALNGSILSLMNEQVEKSTERGIQQALDDAVQAKAAGLQVRTVTLTGVDITPEGGLDYEGLVWLRPSGQGCRVRTSQALAQLARPAGLIRAVLN